MSTQASFRARCPHCSKTFSVRAELEGKTVACPNPACGKSVTVSAPADTYSLAAQPYLLPGAPTKGVDPVAGPTVAKGTESPPADDLLHHILDQLQKWLPPLTGGYWGGLKQAGNPKLFGDYIAFQEGNAAALFKFTAAAIVLTSAVAFVLPNRSLIEFTTSGVVNNLIMMLICALGGLLIATVTYKPLRWLGGQGSLGATLFAAVYVTALYYPILSLLESLFTFITYKPITYVNFVLLIPFCQVLAQIHNLGVFRTMFTVLGANVPVAVVLLSLLIATVKHPGNDASANSARADQRQESALVSSEEPSPAEEEPNDNAIQTAVLPMRTVPPVHADCSKLKLRALKPKSPAELAAIRGADIDRGRSVRASTDPAEIAELVGFIAPGFTAKLPVIPGGVAIVEEHFGRTCLLSTHPLDSRLPCVLTATIDVAKGKQTLLTFDVSHSAAGDWQVIVLANGESLYNSPVDRQTAHNGWLAVSVDLTRFAGKRVVLELLNKATGYSHEWGWWDNIQITDGAGEQSTEPPSADAANPPETAAIAPSAPASSLVASEQENRARKEREENVLGMKFRWCLPAAMPGFWIGKYEVTQSEWKRLMGALPSRPLSKGKGDRYPIYNVSLDEAMTFCQKLTDLERKAGRLPAGLVYRLPTEAEWEYACRAGTTTDTAFGAKMDSTQANFNGDWPYNGAPKGPNIFHAVQVGSYLPNIWEINDMHGNVKEFTTTPGHVRGGSWFDSGRNCCSSIFIPDPPSASESVGFRVALVPPE